MDTIKKLEDFFSYKKIQIVILGKPGKGKSKSLIYAFFHPLIKQGKITQKEFEKIIQYNKTNTEKYLVDLFGESRAYEIETAMKMQHLKSK